MPKYQNKTLWKITGLQMDNLSKEKVFKDSSNGKNIQILMWKKYLRNNNSHTKRKQVSPVLGKNVRIDLFNNGLIREKKEDNLYASYSIEPQQFELCVVYVYCTFVES